MATAPDRLKIPPIAPESLRRWVEQVGARTRPKSVHWCDGSEAEFTELRDRMLATGELHD